MTQLQCTVTVLASFDGSHVQPRVLRYAGRTIVLTRVDLVHAVAAGHHKIYHFGVSNALAHYELTFHTGTLRWQLLQVWPAES